MPISYMTRDHSVGFQIPQMDTEIKAQNFGGQCMNEIAISNDFEI